jgi:hypothetical protein
LQAKSLEVIHRPHRSTLQAGIANLYLGVTAKESRFIVGFGGEYVGKNHRVFEVRPTRSSAQKIHAGRLHVSMIFAPNMLASHDSPVDKSLGFQKT